CLAGPKADKYTVINPIIALTINTKGDITIVTSDKRLKFNLLIKYMTTCIANTPEKRPIGILIRLSIQASFNTIFLIWAGEAPIQRSIPNWEIRSNTDM